VEGLLRQVVLVKVEAELAKNEGRVGWTECFEDGEEGFEVADDGLLYFLSPCICSIFLSRVDVVKKRYKTHQIDALKVEELN
jgi:hypothetical protein